MRGWKPISFENLRSICQSKSYDHYYDAVMCKLSKCGDSECLCENCPIWSKLGREDLGVVKKGSHKYPRKFLGDLDNFEKRSRKTKLMVGKGKECR